MAVGKQKMAKQIHRWTNQWLELQAIHLFLYPSTCGSVEHVILVLVLVLVLVVVVVVVVLIVAVHLVSSLTPQSLKHKFFLHI